MRTPTRLSVVGLTALGVLLPVTAASAADSVTRSGLCSGASITPKPAAAMYCRCES